MPNLSNARRARERAFVGWVEIFDMTFGFPAYFTGSRIFNLSPETLLNVVQATLDNLGWRYEMLSAYELNAKVPGNLRSWGEKLKVEISNGGAVRVESRCAVPTQCLDWGKNKDNVRTFFAHLERAGGARAKSAAGEKPPSPFDERGLSPVERMLEGLKEE